MPRPLRIHVPGAMYHITLRGNHRQNIFFSSRDRAVLNELFAEVLDRFNARLHAYCWMTNHIHALIQVSEAPLARIILRVAGRYARITQLSLRTTGHLFEKRYHPVLVDTDEYLLELVRYIHLNPVRAGMVLSPDDYPWSSHHAYVGRRHEPWVTTDFALSMFHADAAQAIYAYQRFVATQLHSPRSVSPLDERNPSDRRILGSDDFAARMLGIDWKPRSRKTIESIIDEACAKFSVSIAQLRSSSRRRALVIARAWIARQVIDGGIGSIAATARQLNRDESSLRRAALAHFSD